MNFMIKMNIINNKKSIINYINDFNERKYIIILLNISNLMKNINNDHKFDKRNFYIQSNSLAKWPMMIYTYSIA